MVTRYCSPVSGLPVIVPSNGGKVESVFTITTAAAPACWPKTALATRAHVPRCVTTILPATPAAVYSARSQPSEMPPEALRSTLTGKAPPGSAAPLALMACVVPMRAPWNIGVGSTAATEIAPSALAGEPVMYALAPLLPAEATTMMPALAALVEACADGSSAVPKGAPSDILITSMSWSTAQSIASTVTSVDPSQPNTRIE